MNGRTQLAFTYLGSKEQDWTFCSLSVFASKLVYKSKLFPINIPIVINNMKVRVFWDGKTYLKIVATH